MPTIAADADLALVTPRLILRPLQPADADALVAILNDMAVIEWLCQVPYPYTRLDADDWIAVARRDRILGTMLSLGAFDRVQQKLVGSISLVRNSDIEAELGYWLGVDHWGQGLATEMVRAMVDWGFSHMGLSGQIAALRADNTRSARVLEKCAFRPIGERIYIRPPRSGCLSGPHWYITRQDWHRCEATAG